MIPVRLICTRSEMNRIAALTAQHYQQVAVMFYLLSRQVFIRHYRLYNFIIHYGPARCNRN